MTSTQTAELIELTDQQFVLAGKATFTVTSAKTGASYTFRVSENDTPGRDSFVMFLNGPDNEGDYAYLGMLTPATGVIRHTNGSRAAADSVVFLTAAYVLRHIWAGDTKGFEMLRSAHCPVCGRRLTKRSSIYAGVGPICGEKLAAGF